MRNRAESSEQTRQPSLILINTLQRNVVGWIGCIGRVAWGMDLGLADSTQPPVVTRLEGDGLHYQKTRQDSKPCSRTTMAGVTALVIIGLLIIVSMLAADFQVIHHHLPYKEQSI